MRVENERKLKDRKKLEIVERMKEKELKRIGEVKKIEASEKFVRQFGGGKGRESDSRGRGDVLSPNGDR